MSHFIDQIVIKAIGGEPLPDTHPAKAFAARLPGWHPMRRLMNGPSQWLGHIDAVYGLLRLFSELYANRIEQAGHEGLLHPDVAAPDIDAERDTFLRIFPDDALYERRACKLHEIYAEARSTIDKMTVDFTPIHTEALRDFDNTFAKLVRAVRWT